MSIISSSTRHDAVTSNDCYRTPSPPAPQDDSSHDEYTPTHQSIRSGTVWTTPTQRSNTASIATAARTALDNLYTRIYGQDSIRCLLTQGEGALQVAHAVQRASKSSEVSCTYALCLRYLIAS
jgi:hypothetical protein